MFPLRGVRFFADHQRLVGAVSHHASIKHLLTDYWLGKCRMPLCGETAHLLILPQTIATARLLCVSVVGFCDRYFTRTSCDSMLGSVAVSFSRGNRKDDGGKQPSIRWQAVHSLAMLMALSAWNDPRKLHTLISCAHFSVQTNLKYFKYRPLHTRFSCIFLTFALRKTE